MRKIKWENIVFVGMIILGVASVMHHIELNGFYDGLGFEIPMYLMFAFTFRFIVKDIRKNPENWEITLD